MRGKKHLFLCIVLSLLLGTVACSKEDIVFEECNDIFTESYFEEVQEIVYWVGDTKHIIDNETECREVFALFSSLTLTEIPDSEEKELVYGFTRIDFVTEDGLKRTTMRTGHMNVDSVSYRVDKDILDEIREIVFGEE